MLDEMPDGSIVLPRRALAAEWEPLAIGWFEIDTMPRLIIDDDLNVLHANAASRDLVAGSNILVLKAGRLIFREDDKSARFIEKVRILRRDGFENLIFLPKVEDGLAITLREIVVAGGRAIGVTLRGLPRNVDSAFEKISKLFQLTSTEIKVVSGLLSGLKFREIALSQGCSRETVKSHTRNIYRKLSVHSRTELIILFSLISSV